MNAKAVVSVGELERPWRVRVDMLTAFLFFINSYQMLEEALGAYEKAAGKLEEFRARVARAEVDKGTLNDHSLPEDQAMTKELNNAQRLKSVYTARAAHKEKELARLGPELEEAIRPAEGRAVRRDRARK